MLGAPRNDIPAGVANVQSSLSIQQPLVTSPLERLADISPTSRDAAKRQSRHDYVRLACIFFADVR